MKKLLLIAALLMLPTAANAGVSINIGVGGWGGGGWWGYGPGYPLYGYEIYRPDYALPPPSVPFYYHVRPYGYGYGYGRPYYRPYWHRRWR